MSVKVGVRTMSSDDDGYGADKRQGSITSIPPPSAGGAEVESPALANIKEEPDRRTSLNGQAHTTANEIANTDEKVRNVLYSDVWASILSVLMCADWIECSIKSA